MTQGSAAELGAGDADQVGEALPAQLVAEQSAAALDLSLANGGEPTDPAALDGAAYSRRFESVLLQQPQTGPNSFRQLANRDVMGNFSVYGNESIPVLRDGGKLANASAGMFADRVTRLTRAGALEDEEVTVWVIDDHGVHAKVFLDSLRTTDQATYDRTRVVLINQSEDNLTTIQHRNVLDGHERVDYRAAANLRTLQHNGQAPLAIIAPDLPNRQQDVYQVFHAVPNSPEAETEQPPKDFELQRGVKAKGDMPLVTIDPESGLTDLAILDNMYGLGAAASAEGRTTILKLGERLSETARDVETAETPLRRHERSVSAALEGTADHQLQNFTPSQEGALTPLLEQLRPHGMLLTSGYLNSGSKISPSKLRRVEGAVTTYTAELGDLSQQADRARTNAMMGTAVLPRDGDYGYALFDTTTSAQLRIGSGERFNSDQGVRAPDMRETFLANARDLAAARTEQTTGQSLYEALIGMYPSEAGNYDLTVDVARQLNAEGHHDLAASVAEAAIRLAPHVCTSALLEAGRAYVGLGQTPDAAQRFEWAHEISPNSPSVHHEMMRLYRTHHQWDRYIVAAGRYLRDARGLDTERTIKLMRAIVSAAEREKNESAEDPFPSKTVVVESIWIDQESGEPQVERQLRYLPRWMMAQIKAADLSANYADTVRRLLDYADDMPKEDKIAAIDWFNQKYEQLSLRHDPTDPDSAIGERELWPDRAVRALWPDLPQDRTHRLIYTGESTLADDELESPQALLNMLAQEQAPAGDGTAELPAIAEAGPRPAHIELGLVPDPLGRRPSTLYANLDTLNRHVLIAGESGSGKSNACRNILEELTAAGVPWLVIEASKSEYGAMAGRLEGKSDVYVISPGDTDSVHQVPGALNFLEPEPGFPILAHIDNVQDALLAAFEGDEPFPQVMSQALVRVYEKHGWDMTTGHAAPGGREPTTPTLEDLIETAMEIIDGAGYEKNKEDVKGFVRMRIASLGVGTLGDFLEGPNSFDFADLQSRNVVLNLNNMGDDKMKSFLTAMFLAKRNQYLEIRDKQLRKARSQMGEVVEEEAHRLAHFTMIEEAGRLLKKSANQASNSAVAKIAASFATVRAHREGIGAIFQGLDDVHDDVIRNTALKMVFRTPHASDQSVLASTMNMDLQQATRMSNLKNGQAFVYRSGDNAPVRMFTVLNSNRERELPNRSLPPIRGRQASIRQASRMEIHEAEIAIGAKTPEGAWMRSWVEFMTMAYVSGKKLPALPEQVRAHVANMSPTQRRLQIRHAAGKAVARRTSVLTTFDPKRLQASIESAANDIAEHGVGAGTLPPREFVVPQLGLLAEDAVVHRPFYRGQKPDPEDIAPPLQHRIPAHQEPRGRRATFAERADALGRHQLSMRHPNEIVSTRNARIGNVAMFGVDGARQLFDEDLALATGEATITAQELAMTHAMGIGGGPGTVGWGVETLSLPKRVFHKHLPAKY